MLNFDPSGFGIARHLTPSADVRARGRFGGDRLTLRSPWKRGDVSTEARAVREAQIRIREIYDRKFVHCTLKFKPPGAKYEEGASALEAPRGTDVSATPLASRIFGRWYFIPSPFRVDENDVLAIEYSPAPNFSDEIDLVGVEQPMLWPASNTGLYYYFEAHWKEGVMARKRSQVPAYMLALFFCAAGISGGLVTGKELVWRCRLTASGISDLVGMLENSGRSVRASSVSLRHVSGAEGARDRDYLAFTEGVSQLLPPLLEVFARGLGKIKSD